MGTTLTHERIFTKNPEFEQNWPDPEWDEATAVESAAVAIEHVRGLGIGTMIDLTVPGLGRYVPRIQQVAARALINIIVATGYYTIDVLPAYFQTHGSDRPVASDRDPLEVFFVRDLEDGVGETGVKAAVIKVATDADGIVPDVHRVLTAAARAHLQTSATIMTHSHAAERGGLEQQRFFQDAGVPVQRVLIGHCGDATDIAYLR